jgi:hypothetical protein
VPVDNAPMTKFLLAVFVVGISTLQSFGQTNACDSVYTLVDQMPVYGNGTEDVMRYLLKNLKVKAACHPENLKKLTWTINKDGKVIDIDVIGLEEKCKAEVIDQMQTFPAWTPGKLNGNPVCVRMVFPMHIHPGH